jgi:hypothetical protein
LHGQDTQNGIPIVDEVNDVELIDADGSVGTLVTFVKTANPDDSGDLVLPVRVEVKTNRADALWC